MKVVTKLCLLFFSLFLMNCKKEDGLIIKPPSSDYRNAIQMAVGNTWEFEVVFTNLQTGEITKGENEIIAILDSAIVDGKTAFEMRSNQNYFFERILVDSAGYLVDVYNGTILFSGINLEKTLVETEGMHIGMTNLDSLIHVPVGSYETVNYKSISKSSGSIGQHFYAKGIGLVKQVYIHEGKMKEHNLVDYNLK